jgi:hypothetical protein
MAKRFGAFSSSTNPEEVANTVKGIVLALASLIILVAGQFGVPLAESDVAVFAQNIGLAAGALWTLYGLGMKVVVHFTKQA